MHKIANPICLTFAITALAGCGSLPIDYVAPTTGSQSTIRVTATYQTVNSRVLVHGADVCDFSQARVAAILTKWDSILVPQKEALFRVPANQEIAISMPAIILQSAYISGGQAGSTSIISQPVVKLRPEPNAVYEIVFSDQNAPTYKLISSDVETTKVSMVNANLDRSCKLSRKNIGDDRAIFYLLPRDNK